MTRKLAEIEQPASCLQVLLPRVVMSRVDGGLRVELEVSDDLEAIAHGREKPAVAERIDRREGAALEEAVRRLRAGEGGAVLEAAFEGFALRHASAGAFPSWEDHTVLFWRDVAPVGWNIANGASSTTHEMAHVTEVAARELAEELMFVDRARGALGVAGDARSDEVETARRLWSERLGVELAVESLAVTWQGGPDTLAVTLPDGGTVETPGLHVLINAEDFGIECVRRARIDAPEGMVPIDGEILDGRLLDRVVGIFDDVAAGVPVRSWRGGAETGKEPGTTLCPVTAKLSVS